MKCPTSMFLFFFISFFSSTLSRNQNTLHKGSSLSVEHHNTDVLVSPDGTFTCGFYSFGENSYWFAIWFTHSKDRTAVWVANRDKPVNRQGSKIFLGGDGAMVLTDVDNSVAWKTNGFITVDKAELLDSGNLVLKGHDDKIQWKSFDYPTDTLLPKQLFTKSMKLVSSLGKGRFDPGYFSLYFDSDNVLKMLYDGPEITSLYWPTPGLDIFQNERTNYNSTRSAVFDEFGRFVSSDKLRFNASDRGYGVKRRLTIDYDGNLRLYSLNKGGLWEISWEALAGPCKVHGICGRNGVCIYAPEPKCSCLRGYKVASASNWNQGCRPRFNITCSQSQVAKVTFVEVPNTDFYGYDFNYSKFISFEDCKRQCLQDCRCEAFSYRVDGQGICYPKVALFNGLSTPSFPGSIYLKVPVELKTSETNLLEESNPKCLSVGTVIEHPWIYNIRTKKVRWAYLYWFAFALGLIEVLVIALGWWFLFKRHGISASLEKRYLAISSQFRRFSYRELKKATKGFREELGQGASGAVYKGVLDDDRVVAVKRLRDVYQGEEVFWGEVSTIGNIYHINLVRMWGFCSEGRHRLLVYEYVENQSLDKHLFSSKFLGWKERYKVALGTAKALAYLHHECLEWVIHCDIKPENILLDCDFEPKVADFGLAKLSKRDSPISELTQIRGTKGYMAPEWAINLPITAKVDVFSYGVVILELVKGVRLSNTVNIMEDNEDQISEFTRFIRTVKRKVQYGEDLWTEDIVDPRLRGELSQSQVSGMVKIGISCVEEDRNKRPTMDSVVQILLECEDRSDDHITD